MKRLEVGFMLVVVVMFLACEDIVIGDSPIVIVGEVCYVFTQEGDGVEVFLMTYRGDVTVERPYDDDTTITFEQELTEDILKVIVTTSRAKVYSFITYFSDEDCEVFGSYRLHDRE